MRPAFTDLSVESLVRLRQFGVPPEFAGALRHVGLYAYRVGVLKRITRLPPSGLEQCEKLEQLRALEHGVRIAVATCVEPPAPGVDTAADLERARHRVAVTR